MRLTFTLAVAVASISTVTSAQTERDLGSHEHGSASLNIAIDKTSVFVELDTPWNNLVGFEHKPGTAAQHELVDNTLALLQQPEKLFSIEGGNCAHSETVLENSMGGEHEDEHGDEHDDKHDDKHDDRDDKHDDEHDDKHDDKHDDEHDDKHDDKHDDGDDKHDDKHDKDGHGDEHNEEEETHSAVLVSYMYQCDNGASVASIGVKLFELWSDFDDLDVQLLGPGGQALVELNPGNSMVDTTAVQ
ncbi:hypothetical protein AB833_09800 [Chromatiales bacterium (ex Bugula neritina AB1)]|nr:hypothetical protein AB833_09800 [Chromatiales bacterium (ex Bugula neritina AB1)]